MLPSARELMLEAERATGLSDFGPDLFRRPLEVLLDAINSEAQLHELGERRARRRLLESLCTRLRIVDDRKRIPGIAAQPIVNPMFVLGLPRAGTTFLHNLLAQDPDARSPMTWEILYPSPPPVEATYATDPRIERAAEAMEFEGFMGAELQSIHPFDARRPEECNFIWEHSLLTVNYIAWWNVPSYARLLGSTDFRAVYAEHRSFLQHLQVHYPRPRWVLKSPAHLAHLDALNATYPDAIFVQCHRDPAKVMPSLSSNLAAWRRTFSDHVPAGDFGMLEMQAQGLENVAAFRAKPGIDARFVDAHYLDVQSDPLTVVRRIYAHFGLEFTARCEATMRAWLAADRDGHARGPRHSYDLGTYGLDLARIDSVFGDYVRRYGVTLER